ncbi:MAG TPA: hypothetical protein VM283_00020, partial [Armatimonadota bacterium]|nr:hypothetical protein [Armatimonadota bacterium]
MSAEADMQSVTVTETRASLVSEGVEATWDDGRLAVSWPDHGAALQCLPPQVTVDGETLEVSAPRWVTELRAV